MKVNSSINRSRISFSLGLTITLVLAMRLATLGHFPFLDAGDSRYALTAKLMLDDGEFFVPKVYQGGHPVPFWSKPPFHYWLAVLSEKTLGESEFAARLPSFIAGLIMLALTGYGGSRLIGREGAMLAVLMLETGGLFYFLAGSTLVDLTLSSAITGVMVSGILATRPELGKERSLWGYLLFVFLAIGFLTKGPIAIVFPGVAIASWMFVRKDFQLLRELPWTRGIFTFLLLTAPVFLLQEYFTPGYLKYFFLNENLLRYFVSDLEIKYGSGHRQPYGSSWFYLVVGFLPWSLLVIPVVWRKSCRAFVRDPVLLYLVCWFLAPTAVLTFARQLLGTYLVPAFGGLSLFVAASYLRYGMPTIREHHLRAFRSILFVLVLVSAAIFLVTMNQGFSSLHTYSSVFITLILLKLAISLRYGLTFSDGVKISSLALALFYTTQTLNLCKYMEQRYSTAGVLQVLTEEHRVHRPRLYFPFGVPSSAYLYAKERLVDGDNSMTLSLKSDNELIVIREKQAAEFYRRFGHRFEQLMQHGKWLVLHAENHLGTCESAMRRSHLSDRQTATAFPTLS